VLFGGFERGTICTTRAVSTSHSRPPRVAQRGASERAIARAPVAVVV
jgi:hypothetical protein